ncbi:DNA alkylation repair protein [Actinoplanes sp. NPDC024001]|uniref:DNA alkylation repair protein n=1 Tax=Actinoplanes sp. NPDC024001 TaxID=3154598 RepID=UPI0033E5D3C4
MQLTAAAFLDALHAEADDAERDKKKRYLHTGPDTQVIGVRMGTLFATAKAYHRMPLDQVEQLLASPYYEARMGAVSILDFQARHPRITDAERRALYDTYLNNHDRIDNWDLVDRAAPRVIGWYLLDKPRDILYDLAASPDQWRRRTAITATLFLIRNHQYDDARKLADLLADDPAPLVRKSVAIARRELGKADTP